MFCVLTSGNICAIFIPQILVDSFHSLIREKIREDLS